MPHSIETIARDLAASLKQISIPDHFGWTMQAVQLRRSISLCNLATETARAGDERQALRLVQTVSEEHKSQSPTEKLRKGFQETACWLWSQRRCSFDYRGGWFHATGVIIELETTFADYCQEIERNPSSDWCRQTDAELWLPQSHLFGLVCFQDPAFCEVISDAMKFMLHKSPAREHHQAKLHSCCPKIHDAIFEGNQQ